MDELNENVAPTGGKVWVPPIKGSDGPIPPKASGDVVRLSVNMNQETTAALKKMMKAKNISATEAVRRATAIMEFFDKEQEQGRIIRIVNKRGKVINEIELL
jgi:hypothetical protein